MAQMQTYTVLLLYPDHMDNVDGPHTYQAIVDAPSESEALYEARFQAEEANEGQFEAFEFIPLAMYVGEQWDILGHVEE